MHELIEGEFVQPPVPQNPTNNSPALAETAMTIFPTHERTLNQFRQELLVTGYSTQTIKMYMLYAQKFLEHTRKNTESLTKQDVISFLAKAREQNVSNSTLSLMHSSLRYFLQQHLKLSIVDDIKIPKKGKKLPSVLTMNEIKSIFQNTKHGRNRLLLQFIYSTGCRVSEAAKMKTEDVDWENGTAQVKEGKGNKDRMIILSQKWGGEMKKYLNRKKINLFSCFPKRMENPFQRIPLNELFVFRRKRQESQNE